MRKTNDAGPEILEGGQSLKFKVRGSGFGVEMFHADVPQASRLIDATLYRPIRAYTGCGVQEAGAVLAGSRSEPVEGGSKMQGTKFNFEIP